MATRMLPARRRIKQKKEKENKYLENDDQREPLEPDEEELKSIRASLKSFRTSLNSRNSSKDEILISVEADNILCGRVRAFLSHVSPLGDIRLTEEQKRQGLNFERYSNYKWPNSTIPYKIQESDYSPEELQIINNAILGFNQTNLHLVPYNENETEHRDFVYVFSGDGHWSYLGKIGGKQKISLESNGGLDKNTVQHEFMHAAGLTHEHNRCDRDDYVEVLWENITKKWQSEYEKILEDDLFEQGQYDYYSIMHYTRWAPLDDVRKIEVDAFKIKDTSVDKNRLGEGEKGEGGLTEMDIIKLNNRYPK